MRHATPLDEVLVDTLRPYGPMLSTCTEPGCTTLTMGGTCVEHDLPVTVTFERGRPFVVEASPAVERVPVAG